MEEVHCASLQPGGLAALSYIKESFMWKILGILFLLICLFFIAVMIYDSNRFVTVKYSIADARICKRTRIVLLADLHNKKYGRNNAELLAAIDASCPDLILSAGDLMTSVKGKSMETAERLVQELAAKYPFYYANGNHEYRIYHDEETYGSMGQEYRSALKEAGVCLLENESAALPDLGIRILGLDLPVELYKKFREVRISTTLLEKMIGRPKEGTYDILLAHNPAFFESYADWGADLTLSGHVHGGVMRLPGLGGVLSTSLTLFPKYDGGLFERNQKRMIVSRGLGSHTIPIRIFNPAELVVIDLEPGES